MVGILEKIKKERLYFDGGTGTVLQKMGLKAGRSVTITYKALDKTGEYIVRKVVRGVVVELYKHFFSVKIGKRVICYRYNEFLGNENVKVKLKA